MQEIVECIHTSSVLTFVCILLLCFLVVCLTLMTFVFYEEILNPCWEVGNKPYRYTECVQLGTSHNVGDSGVGQGETCC